MSRVLISGGSGFIGTCPIKVYAVAGHEVLSIGLLQIIPLLALVVS